MANIAPAMSSSSASGWSRRTAGVASPLTILAAIVAIALLGNTLDPVLALAPVHPLVRRLYRPGIRAYPAVVTAIVLSSGYILAVASVVAISGGWTRTSCGSTCTLTSPGRSSAYC